MVFEAKELKNIIEKQRQKQQWGLREGLMIALGTSELSALDSALLLNIECRLAGQENGLNG